MSQSTCPECSRPIEEGKPCSNCQSQPHPAPAQTQESSETAWHAFRKTPLWIILLVCFVALPAILSPVALIARIVESLYYGQPFMKPEDFFVSLLPIIVLITAIVIMRNWRLKTPIPGYDKLAMIIIAALGLVLPYIAGGIGAAFSGHKLWFDGSNIGSIFLLTLLPHSIAIGTALVMYRASMRFGDRLKYLPIVSGYFGWAYFYLGFNIAGDAQAGIALLF